MSRIPALFVSHGSPMFALEPGRLGPNLARVAAGLPALRAIVVVSPHWQTRGVRVTAAAAPETIHDFGGFPAPLYALQYRQRATRRSQPASSRCCRTRASTPPPTRSAALIMARGCRCATSCPLPTSPCCRSPCRRTSTPPARLRLGEALRPPARAGVLVIGSGSLTHNLYEFRRHIADPEYAQQFADWVADAVARRDVDALVDYRQRAPHAARAHPTEEHYLPLLVALGASGADEARALIEGGMTYDVLSMDSFGFGLDADKVAAVA